MLELKANRGANLVRSKVTNKSRRISRWPIPHGMLWNTYDIAVQTPDKDPIRNPTFTGGFDAGEHIASRANGLHEYALFAENGQRQDAVPPEIASDDTVSPPVPLQPMMSCVRCHNRDEKEFALRNFADFQSRLLSGKAKLLAADPEVIEQLASFYGRQVRLARELNRDRQDYAAALARATGGMKPHELAEQFALVIDRYEQQLVTPAVAAFELGLEFEIAIGAKNNDGLALSTDVIIISLIEGHEVQRSQWEVSFAEAALLVDTKDEE